MSESHTWPDVLTHLIAGRDLDADSASWAMEQVMSGNASPSQVAGFLMALAAKGETVDEVRGVADTMLAHATPLDAPVPSLDIVGTGGDRANTVNISTMASIVTAASGISIVKHGNRAASSKSGTADCLEALGLDLSLQPERVGQVAREVGITFCFAQVFHPSMRHAAVTRRDLGVPTIFNVLGPITNPARPTYSVVGVASARMAPIVAGVFAARGTDAAVFRGDDGLDELTITTTSHVWWVKGGEISEYVVDPRTYGFEIAPIETLRGGEPADNAAVVLDLLAGKQWPVRSAVLLNAGIAAAVANAGPDTVTDQASFEAALRAGIDQAAQAIDSGAATAKLQEWKAATLAGR
ncbi:MAG: anthranilate phosphoribosyltransferase [Dermatophilus congolensis]|nr:anthranilate phosphoribosyltransferase [Dermatophilus congolensis]